MTFLTHAVTGAAVGVVLSETTGVDYTIAVPASIAFSLFPDINLLWRGISDHHRDFTHYPVFLITVTVLVFLFEYFLGSASYILSLSLLFSSMLHLVLDTFGVSLGVHWLAPFNYREFSFTPLDKSSSHIPHTEKALLFYKSGQFLYELGAIAVAMGVIFIPR